MPLVRLRGRALALAFGSLMIGACAAVPPPVFTPPHETSPAAAVDPRDEAHAGRVSGRLLTADGRPLIAGAIILSPLNGEAPPPSAPDDVYLGPDGSFEFRNVPPGQYQIRARGQTSRSASQLYATFNITVGDRDLTGIDMILAPGSSVSGQLVVEAVRTPRPTSFQGVRVRAPFADGSSFGDAVSGEVGPDGAFAIDGLMRGTHVITVEGLRAPWVLASVSHRGRDITDTGFEARARQDLQDVRVTITDVASEIAGLVLDGDGAGVAGAIVVAVPPGPQFWRPTSRRLGVTRADDAGRYRVRGLPPGEYRLTASLDLDPDGLHRPGVLEALASSGVPVTIRGTETRQVDLRLVASDGRIAAARR
jgi:hypothetical protein